VLNPLLASIEPTLLIAPAAQGGGLEASKPSVKVLSCPCTVAFSLGLAVAASICSANLAAFSASATPFINSPSCISLCAGLSIKVAVP